LGVHQFFHKCFSAPASIDVLRELRESNPEVFDQLEVYVDGGVRRGTYVMCVISYFHSSNISLFPPETDCYSRLFIFFFFRKALCLGARAVGLGRPFLFAQSAYGEDGVVQAVDSA
jgi:L-lactate dehydrogenase (cytochrome)